MSPFENLGKKEKGTGKQAKRDRVHTDEPVSMLDEQKQKNATKLARQKLVSDDLKAKYMIKRDDDREKTPTNDDCLSRKRSSRKDRLDEHKDFWSKKSEHDKDTSSVRSKSSESDSVPTIEEMLHGSSKQAKSFVSKKFENVDHSSPFGSVYSKPSPVVTTSSVSTSSTAAAATAVTSTSSTYHTQPEKIEKSKNEKSKEKTQSKKVEIDTKESKVETQDTSDRKYKKYAKAKSLELGALTKKDKTDLVKPAETKDDSKLDSAEDQAQLNRVERIAKYKEERRKQLKTLQERFAKGESSELPSLFLSSKPEQEDSSISRSRKRKPENKRDDKSLNLEDKKEVEKDIDSERDSADSSSRIRRKLPSVEDVLGTGSTVKDTDKVGNIGQEKLLKKEKEVENIKQYKNEVSKEELSSMTAEQISKRKVAENIERAKHKFVEDDKHASAFDASRFELGTVYTSKKADKKSVPDKSVKQEIKSEENFNKKDSLERSRQVLLGVLSESENVQKKPQAHKDEKQGTAFAQSEIQTQPERKTFS
ncbi:myb-like protein X [Ruditapes philippinarum]|uniref:myb-like protein X n=1 Tax=Ruditapes philippinarum TaxID=129788 RepID=UPI00295A8743|nr:myb-like protein X [Ruditapes philippinarum]